MREIKFQNIGREKKHEVTLFELYEIPVEINGINNAQSFAERRLTFYWMQAQEYLKIKGFEDTTGYFRVIDGAVINSDTVWQPLFAAIEERDLSNGGQTGEYLAALIDHKSRMLLNAWPPTHTEYSVILNEVMLIQEYFFRLFILDEVHPQYSAGKNRTHAGNEVKNKSEFMMEAEELCRIISRPIVIRKQQVG